MISSPPQYAAISYVTFDAVVADVLQAGRGSTIVKRDIRDAFRMVPVAAGDQWLLGFCWRGVSYLERALPFGLRTAPILFNLFAEGLHWILLSRGWRRLHHYLDDFISIFSPTEVAAGIAKWATDDWIRVTDDLAVPRKDSKDEFGTTVPVFGIELDTLTMEARLPQAKMDKLRRLTAKPLQTGWTTLKEMESLAGLLSFCSKVPNHLMISSQTQLGFVALVQSDSRKNFLQTSSGGMTCWMNLTGSVLLTTQLVQTQKFIQMPVIMVLVPLYSRTVPHPQILLSAADLTLAFGQNTSTLKRWLRWHTL